MIAGVDPITLVQLVVQDRRIHELRQSIAAGRRRRRDLERLLGEHTEVRDAAKAKLDEVQGEIRRLEREIEDFKRQAKTHGSRLNEISDTREYRALNDEIRYVQRKASDNEETVLSHMEAAEKLQAEFDGAQGELDQKAQSVRAEVAQIQADEEARSADLRDAEKARDAILKEMPDAAQRFYERRARRIEMPIVWIREGACGYCHHKLTPQNAIEVLDHKTLIECESCGRIVVHIEENGAKSVSGTEAS